jgi:hypothetical protein
VLIISKWAWVSSERNGGTVEKLKGGERCIEGSLGGHTKSP